MKNKKSVTLIGMPASGKSTIGKIIAKKLNWDFIDLDDLIKEKTGKKYDEILDQDGERELLNLESQLALGLDFRPGMIFSPGGSIIYSSAAIEKIKAETKIIYINLSFGEIEKRLKLRSIKGGIVGLKEKGLVTLFQERDVVYRQFADFIIESDNLNEEQLAQKCFTIAQTEK